MVIYCNISVKAEIDAKQCDHNRDKDYIEIIFMRLIILPEPSVDHWIVVSVSVKLKRSQTVEANIVFTLKNSNQVTTAWVIQLLKL